MKVEFFLDESPGDVLGTAEWDGNSVNVRSEDETIRAAIVNAFRPTPVVVPGKPERMVQPGDLTWFLAAAAERAGETGLRSRLVAGARSGWDPAGTYRPLRAWAGRREGGSGPSRAHEPGYF